MVVKFPVILCFIGAVSWFSLAVRLRRFKVPQKPPARSAHLSQEERQRKIVIASWITFAGACVFVVGGIVLFWMENSN